MTIFSLLRSPKTPRGNFLEKGQKIAYFMMNFKTLKTGYTPVNEVDTNDFLHEIASQKSLRQNKIRTFWEAIIVLELAHLCIAFLAYSAYLWHSHSPTLTSTDLDKYFQLSNYNTIKYFNGSGDLMKYTPEAKQLWDDIQETDGVVALPKEWAAQNNLVPSMSHPDDESKGIYQVDMWHSLHCLYRIRNRIIANLTLEQWPRSDPHTLHCLDYIRNELQCNSNVLLQATTDFISYKGNHGHVCRDNDAIMSWAAAHHWEGNRKYLKDVLGLE